MSSHKTRLLWNFRIYVGESIDYTQNAECENSPYLTDGDSVDGSNVGTEIWCNRQGEYVSLVRDFNDYSDMEYISICDFAIFGDNIQNILIEPISYSMIIGEPLSITILHANYATEEVPQIYIRSRKETVPERVTINFSE